MREVNVFRGEDGFWVAECPSLPGCISQGETREEAVDNIQEAIQLYIETLDSELRSEYDLKKLRIRKTGAERINFDD